MPTPAATIAVDLTYSKGEPQRFEVPPGMIAVRLAHRAPAAHYRVKVMVNGSSIGADPRPPFPQELTMPADPECAQLLQAKQQLLQVADEKLVAAAVLALRNAAQGSSCRTKQFELDQLAKRVEPEVAEVPISAGAPVPLVVERLDPAGTVVNRWQVLLQGPDRPPGWAYRTEGQWLVGETVRDIAMLVEYARTKKLAPVTVLVDSGPARGALPIYRVRVQGADGKVLVDQALAVEGHVWAAETYRPIAAELLRGAGLRSRQGDSAGTLEALVDLRAPVLEAENQRLSRLLAANPLDPQLHERAAFLLGAVGFREAAYSFSDVRTILCGMAAHLGLAAALGGQSPTSPEGSLAVLTADFLAARRMPALAQVRRLHTTLTKGPAAAWLRALEMRAGHDWRLLEKRAEATLVERLAYARVLQNSVGPARVLDFFDERRPEPIPDWGRVLRGGSVESGNRFAATATSLELADAAAIPSLGTGSSPKEISRRVQELVEKAQPRLGSGTQPVIVSPGLWAATIERHLLAAAAAEVRHLSTTLRLKSESEARTAELSDLLGSLPLAAFLKLSWSGDAGVGADAACAAIADLIGRHPEAVEPGWWNLARQRCVAGQGAPLPQLGDWLEPAVPAGTAYTAAQRVLFPRTNAKIGPDDAAALYALDPRAPELLDLYVGRKLGRTLTAQDVKDAWGPALEYSTYPLQMLLKLAGEDTAECLRLAKRLCDLDVEQCMDYGNELVEAGRPDEARKAYELAVAKARDRVRVANQAGWLADDYLEHGRQAEALALVEEAAKTYSGAGLHSKARLLERLGRFREAEAVYKIQSERYADPFLLSSFYVRHESRGRGTEFKAEAAAARKELFPAGLERVARGSLRPIPQGDLTPDMGLLLSQDWMTPSYRRLGAQPNDVVLVADGIRVRNEPQYFCVLSFRDAETLDLVVQRGGQLVTLSGRLPRNKYGPPAAARATP